jgi:flagellar protein FliS
MSSNVNDTYLEARVMSASPVELVRILYDAAAQAVREARRHLAEGDIAARSRQISKAGALLAELAASLDAARGGEIAARLKALYDYLALRLLDANVRQADEPLAEVLNLLETLAEGWRQVAEPPAQPLPPAPASSGIYDAASCAAPAGYGSFMAGRTYAMESQSWSA